MKFLTTSDAPHLDTKALFQKLGEFAKTVDLDVSSILAEQIKDPVLGTVRSWIRKKTPPDIKSPEIQQSKGLLRYCKSSTDFFLKKKDKSFATMNQPTNYKKRTSVCFSLYSHSLHASNWDITTK